MDFNIIAILLLVHSTYVAQSSHIYSSNCLVLGHWKSRFRNSLMVRINMFSSNSIETLIFEEICTYRELILTWSLFLVEMMIIYFAILTYMYILYPMIMYCAGMRRTHNLSNHHNDESIRKLEKGWSLKMFNFIVTNYKPVRYDYKNYHTSK